jgi:hypothetical protein
MIDFLYCLDYDDHRLDTEGQPPASEPHDSIPPTMFKFHGGIGSISDPDVYKATVAKQPTGLNCVSLLINAKVYIIADKYDIHSLKEWAVTKYKEVLPATWNSTSFVESARLIYENTVDSDRMLREVIIRKASENVKALFDRGEFVELLRSHSEFAIEVLKDVVFNQLDDVQKVEADELDSWGSFGKKGKKKSPF